jgi:hypothetical protein
VSVRIVPVLMCHPLRAAFVNELRVKLDRPSLAVYDTCGSRWDTGKRSMLAGYHAATTRPDGTDADVGEYATHTLILQDDAVIPHDLIAGAERAVAHAPPEALVSLYLGNNRQLWRAMRTVGAVPSEDASWVVMPQLHAGVGFVVPVSSIPAIVKHGERRPDLANFDRRIRDWCVKTKTPVWYTWPSLVSHREGTPSLVPGRNGYGRHAQQWVGENASALDWNPNGGVVQVPRFQINQTNGHIRPPRVYGAARRR